MGPHPPTAPPQNVQQRARREDTWRETLPLLRQRTDGVEGLLCPSSASFPTLSLLPEKRMPGARSGQGQVGVLLSVPARRACPASKTPPHSVAGLLG